MDSRLGPAVLEQLQAHLLICPSCQNWNQQQLRLREEIKVPEMIQPSPGFYAKIQNKIDKTARRPRLFGLGSPVFEPFLLRAAMFLILIFSALFGFFLGGRLDAPAAETVAAVFNQTLNLNAYADLPADSFGAVYDRLLRGELQ